MESCDACIDQACVELQKLGWTKESVKVIGKSYWFCRFLDRLEPDMACPVVPRTLGSFRILEDLSFLT